MLSKFRVYLESVRFYHLCKLLSLPPDQKDQLLRAASSVGRNVGEAYGRVSYRDKRRFYRISLGSLRECTTVFDQEDVQDPRLRDIADFLGGALYKLTR